MPPLVYVALALISGAVAPASATGPFPVRQALDLANALVNGAPVLVGATLGALVVALVRWVTGRR
ncbi:MAG: hypothetical protein KY433_08700 [Actinobacteria bacterium]|nr:hypothetical protein [Actinomycetota bacterium]